MSNEKKSWLHSDIYDRVDSSENSARSSLFKFGTFGNLIESLTRFFTQIFIAGFLFALLFILFTDPAMQDNDLYFLITWETVKLTCATISVFLSSKIFSDMKIEDLGLKLNRQALQDLSMGFMFVLAIFTFEFIFFQGLGWISINHVSWKGQSFVSIISNTFLLLIIYVFVGWSEELLSRGFHLRIFSRGLNRPLGVFLSSIIFALLHIDNPDVTLLGLIFIFIFGIVLAMAFLRTGQLWLAIGIHASWDFFVQVFGGQSISGLQLFHLMEINFKSAFPGSFVMAILELCVIAVFIRFYTSHRQPKSIDW